MLLPLSEIEMPLPAVSVTSVLPDVLEEIIEVVPVPALTVRLPSLLTEPSTSVAVSVSVLLEREMVKIPAGSSVTVPPDSERSMVLLSPVPSPALMV